MISTVEQWSSFLDHSKAMTGTLEEIQTSGLIDDDQKKVEYLLTKALKHMFNKDYQRSAVIAWYILSEIDHESSEAKDILKQTYRMISVN